MGTYAIPTNELIDDFEGFLLGQEGDVYALTIAECWNKLARKYQWEENLIVIDKRTKKVIKD